MEHVVKAIRETKTSEEVRGLVAGLKTKQLREVGATLGAHMPSTMTKSELVQKLVAYKATLLVVEWGLS